MNDNCQCNKIKLNFFDRRDSQLNTSLLFEKMGGRLNVDFKNRLKLDLFLKSYIYSERGDFAASFYNKNSILMFFSKWSIFRGGGLNKEYMIHLIESHSKIEHNLIKCDINKKDRQNFPSYRKISSENVLNLLNNENFKETYVYLSLLRSIIIGFIEKSSTIEKRLYHVWTVVFTCRLWWSWIHYWAIKNSRNDNNSELVKQAKSNNFITKPTFWCIEINAYILLYIILSVIKNILPVDALNTFLFNSQTCENTFRIARALSGPYSSITTYTVKSL